MMSRASAKSSQPAAHRALRGDLARATLDALRDTPRPMTTKELARHVMAERGLNTADVSLLQLFTRHTGSLLRRKRGLLRSVKGPSMGGSIFGRLPFSHTTGNLVTGPRKKTLTRKEFRALLRLIRRTYL